MTCTYPPPHMTACILLLMRQVEHLQGQTRGGGTSRVEEWLEDKVNAAELQCGRLEARVIRSEAVCMYVCVCLSLICV